MSGRRRPVKTAVCSFLHVRPGVLGEALQKACRLGQVAAAGGGPQTPSGRALCGRGRAGRVGGGGGQQNLASCTQMGAWARVTGGCTANKAG